MAKFRNSSDADLSVGDSVYGRHVAKDEVFDVPDELVLEEGHEHTSDCTHSDDATVYPASLFTRVGGVPKASDVPPVDAAPAQ